MLCQGTPTACAWAAVNVPPKPCTSKLHCTSCTARAGVTPGKLSLAPSWYVVAATCTGHAHAVPLAAKLGGRAASATPTLFIPAGLAANTLAAKARTPLRPGATGATNNPENGFAGAATGAATGAAFGVFTLVAILNTFLVSTVHRNWCTLAL